MFVNNYNRRVTVRGCHIAKAGANGVAFVGDRDAARVPRDWNDRSQSLANARPHARPQDRQLPGGLPGGRLPDLPLGPRRETDRAGADRVVARHHRPPLLALRRAARRHQHRRRLLGRPRDRVLRHLRHGQGNRRPRLVQLLGPRPLLGTGRPGSERRPGLGSRTRSSSLLDAVKTTILRNNRWRCDHGWDIDLDDGSIELPTSATTSA